MYTPTIETPITALTITSGITDHGANATKHLSPQHRYRYSVSACYTLADGRKIADVHIRALTKPKLAEKIDRARRNIAAGEMFASFRGEEYCGTVLKMSLMFR